MIRRLWNRIRPKSQRELQDEYLADSVDLTDLERRLKKLGYNPNLFKF